MGLFFHHELMEEKTLLAFCHTDLTSSSPDNSIKIPS